MPVLTRIVGHRTNGGQVGWEDCRRALVELDRLREDPLLSAWLLAPDEADGVERVDSLFLKYFPGHTVGGTGGRFRLLAAESSDIRPAGLQPPVRSDLPEPPVSRAVRCRAGAGCSLLPGSRGPMATCCSRYSPATCCG